jgi:hypothetical protein
MEELLDALVVFAQETAPVMLETLLDAPEGTVDDIVLLFL